ncbi:hypothetical protein [Micromonospora noduli]|uniref:Uncharacterized protein n=1 Tax=Micromonospora noduli TaxID=709876 RepID=A0A328MTT2_9ACTN|nr:hypothetical protein [Micromonospora noduli]RAN94343.1 hypothetical protein LAH08_05808 [Micromonospora noduli]RAO25037.1 hypothetical protein MED15_00795 [Micromonospora noduli]
MFRHDQHLQFQAKPEKPVAANPVLAAVIGGMNPPFWSFGTDSRACEGRWAQGPSLIGGPDLDCLAEPVALTDDTPLPPPPDPKLFVTYDGSQGPGKPGNAAGAHQQGLTNVVKKVKDALE